MKEFEVQDRACMNCGTPFHVDFFAYVPDNEGHDKWLESADHVRKYCDRCFRDTSKVMVFVELFCPECGDYKGIYMECTPYSNAHLLTELSVKHGK